MPVPTRSASSATATHTLSTTISTSSSTAGPPNRSLKQSSSHVDIGALSSSVSTSPTSPRERRRPSLSVSPSSFHASSLSSSSSFPDALAQSSKTYMSPPPSPPAPSSRLEESYLSAKRRAHRQSYFEHYPERISPRLREQRKQATDELDALVLSRKEKLALERERNSSPEKDGVQFHMGADGQDHERETQSEGRPSMRKSVSLGAPMPSRSFKQELFSSSHYEDNEVTGTSSTSAPLTRPPRSARRLPQVPPTPKLETQATSSFNKDEKRARRMPKIPTHPYDAFRSEDVSDFRLSNSTYSSSQTRPGSPSPPQTPIEAHSQTSSYEPVEVMVAPVSDVESMDALVDGMDGSSDDDLFKHLQRTKDTFRHTQQNHHHPLYVPPLPVPPKGIVLGHSRDAALRVEEHIEKDDQEDEEFLDDTMSLGSSQMPFPSVAEKRRENGRTASSSTILADMASPTTMDKTEAQSSLQQRETPLSIDEIIRKHTAASTYVPSQRPSVSSAVPSPSSKPNTAVPTISEIIQRHMPSGSSKASPNNSYGSSVSAALTRRHTSPQESDSEPETFDPIRGTSLKAQASIDSISAEALRAHHYLSKNNSNSNSGTQSSSNGSFSTAFSRRHSTYSGKAAVRSAASIRSESASASISKGNSGALDQDFAAPDILSGLSSTYNTDAINGQKKQSDQKEAIATYLRSARITTLLKLTKRPHAAPNRPLTVSVSDLGSKSGMPLLVFLGLGCVRHVMGLYDEMAECMGLRLITVDRWGLGRTEVPSASSSRGVLEWATVIDDVLEQLNIDRCCIMAHSAGSPYALAFANKYPSRVVGDLCLLAPWVGGGAGGGYNWLKYVPNGILKTAQAAEWKIQAWMIGKPPTITYKGIGYSMKAPISPSTYDEAEQTDHGTGATAFKMNDGFLDDDSNSSSESDYEETDEFDERPDEMGVKTKNNPYPSMSQPRRAVSTMGKSRPSTSSCVSGNTLNEYDDLADFAGRFGSRSTFERRRSMAGPVSVDGISSHSLGSEERGVNKKKRGFLGMWKGSHQASTNGINNSNAPPVPPVPAILTGLSPTKYSSNSSSSASNRQRAIAAAQTGGKSRLRSLKSIGSLRNRNGSSGTANRARSQSEKDDRMQVGERSPVLPEQDFSVALDFKLGLDEFGRSDRDLNVSASYRKSMDGKDATISRRSSVHNDTINQRKEFSNDLIANNRRRAGGRRSISLSAAKSSEANASQRNVASYSTRPRTIADNGDPAISVSAMSSASTSATKSRRPNKLTRHPAHNSGLPSPTPSSSLSYQVELGNALIAASHAESSRGTHPDLLQILNHERRPWGFSYSRYPHPVRVWYGDRDERIAKESVDWMREKMCSSANVVGSRCEVKVVKGADHGLMFRTDVVVEVLEHVQSLWNEAKSKAEKGPVECSMLSMNVEKSLNLSPRKLDRPSNGKGIIRASWGYELSNDPFRSF